MKNVSLMVRTLGLSTIAAAFVAAGNAAAAQPDKLVYGDSIAINGDLLSAWARVNGAGKVIWVGLTFPLSIVENPPAAGSGPAGAVAVLNFPEIVQETTYFNHFELQPEPKGHPTNPNFVTKDRYSAPHFDFHFYGIPVAEVSGIPFGPPAPPVAPERLPRGYAQPDISVPQMGRHASLLSEFTAVGPLDVTMIAGFLPDASYMHFIEPMISYEYLLQRQNFTLHVPQPQVLGRSTSYPTELVATYDKELDAYHFVFKGFRRVN